MTVTGLETQLTHSILADIATLGATLQPPKSLLKKAKPPKSSPLADFSAQQPTPARKRRTVQITKATVGITNLVAGYQTAVTVPFEDHLAADSAQKPVPMMCGQCATLSELMIEAHPSALNGSVQLHQLIILHQETHSTEDTTRVINQTPAQQQSHEIEILHATHLSVQVVNKEVAFLGVEPPTIAATGGDAAGFGLPSNLTEQNWQLADAATLAATVTLTSWRTFFHADAVIALCKAASDCAAVARSI